MKSAVLRVTRSIVRRERMGHIDLCVRLYLIYGFYVAYRASISTYFWALSAASDVEKVIYFAGYIVIKVSPNLRKSRILKDLDAEFKDKSKELEANA